MIVHFVVLCGKIKLNETIIPHIITRRDLSVFVTS